MRPRLGTLALVALFAGRYGLAVCSTNCILVNDATDTTHGDCDFGGVGTCSLRDAFTRSQALQGWSMQFAIGTGPQTISLLTNLPEIITRGTIDGRTQPGYAGAPLIAVRRADAGTATHAIHVTADGLVAVKALVINHFSLPSCSDCYGITFDSPCSNFVEGCYIGTDATGTVADGNNVGISINTGICGNTIGGATPDKRNVISGNGTAIFVHSTYDNVIQGNYIGTDVSGTQVLPNGNGIAIEGGGAGNLVGGSAPGEGNVIAGLEGQSDKGVILSQSGTNTVQGNTIGADVTGMVSYPFAIGVNLSAETNDVIQGNQISAVDYGVALGWDGVTRTTGTQIQGNLIGTDATGNAILRGGGSGILLSTARNNLVGGSGAGQGNVIGGFGYGIYDSDSSNTFLGNSVGIGLKGSPIPNSQAGIAVFGAGGNDVVGGVGDGDQNYIAFNGLGTSPPVIAPGVWVLNGSGNRIRGNSIFDNTGLGIDFDFPASALPHANDVGDGDSGPNTLQNFPLVTGVTITPTSIRVQGTLNSKPNHDYGFDFYATLPPVHPRDFLEGKAFLGVLEGLFTDAQGNATFDVTFSLATVPNLWITATAVDPRGVADGCGAVQGPCDTSEFSQRSLFSVSPNHGPASGGTGTTLTGQLFQSGASVTFGPVASPNPAFIDAQTMTASTPPSLPGALLDVAVHNPDGSSAVMQKAFIVEFSDVPAGNPVYDYVMRLASDGVTGGCGGGNYCPVNSVTRAQMAVFLLKARYGPWWLPPPATGTLFLDVPSGSFAADWIEELANEGITGGCGGGNYCPGNPVTRQQMAVFLLKAEHGAAYVPPLCAGIFGDVMCPSLFADWIERLYAESITGGCSSNPLLYCPTSSVTRGQMAVFVVKTFRLPPLLP